MSGDVAATRGVGSRHGGGSAYRIRASDSLLTRRPQHAIVGAMRGLVEAVIAAFRPRASLVAENLALRQQLATLLRERPRPRLLPIDRAFWVVLSRTWSRWAYVLAIVKPATVITWHRRGFARFRAYKSRRRGRPPLSAEVIELIERMTRDNPTWSRRRIASELAKLGHGVSRDTVAKWATLRNPWVSLIAPPSLMLPDSDPVRRVSALC